MKFAILSLGLLAVVAADVSHLNNMYLPPVLSGLSVHSHAVQYAQHNHEIPHLAEVTDNSVAEEASAENNVKTTGKLIVENVKYGPGYAGEIKVQKINKYYGAVEVPHHETASTVAVAEGVATAAAPGSDVYQSTQQQAAYWTGVSQQQEANVAASDSYDNTQQQFSVGGQHQEGEEVHHYQQQEQNLEQKYYTGLQIPEHVAQTVVEHQEEAVVAAAPGSDVYASTQQQANYWTQNSQQQEQEPEKKYYTGLLIPQTNTHTHTTTHVETAVVPGPDHSTQQQAAYYSQQQEQAEAGPFIDIRETSGVETQYANNGGYVY